MNKMFQELINTKEFKEQLAKIPKEEKEELLKSLKEIVEKFEDGIIKPLENLKRK